MSELQLGKLESVRGISPIFKQRAFVVAVVSFVFFTAMTIAYSVRQSFVFLLLAAAFLTVELFTLLGWLGQRSVEFRIFENGFTYKKFVCLWNEIESVNIKKESSPAGGAKINCLIRKTNGREIVLTETIEDLEGVVKIIGEKTRAKTLS